jgi:spore coat protein CotH
VGDGSGASVFDPTRVAQIELAITDADLAILEEQKAVRLGATDDDEGDYVPANLTFDGTDLGTVGIRVKGNSSRRGAGGYASPYKIDTDEFVDGTTLDGEKKLNLHLALEDAALNDYLSYAAWRQFDVAASRTGWAEVTINGEKVALYTTVEQVNEGLLAQYFGDGEGALYKPESPAGRLTYLGSDITAYTNLNYKGEEEINHASFLAFVDVLNNQPVAEWENVMDVDSVLTYFAGNVAVGNWDTYSIMGHNYYLYEAPDGRLSMLPWDMNLSQGSVSGVCPNDVQRNVDGVGFGGDGGGGRERPDFGGEIPEGFQPPEGAGGELPEDFQPGAGGVGGVGPGGEAPLHDRLLTDAGAMARYRKILESFIDGPGSPERLSTRVEVAQGALGSLLTLDIARAPRSRQRVRPVPVSSSSTAPREVVPVGGDRAPVANSCSPARAERAGEVTNATPVVRVQLENPHSELIQKCATQELYSEP